MTMGAPGSARGRHGRSKVYAVLLTLAAVVLFVLIRPGGEPQKSRRLIAVPSGRLGDDPNRQVSARVGGGPAPSCAQPGCPS
jgi:hypothetical protein